MATENRQWRLAARPDGSIKESDFRWCVEPVPELRAGELLVRNVYLSLDPANRIWLNAAESYIPPVQIGEVMRGFALGVVEESHSEAFQEGQIVQGMVGWQDYLVTDGSDLTALPDQSSIPLTAYLGLFGHIGLTAYFGLLDVGRPQPGETLVVSAAAGAVGSLVGQIGKICGCRVVGIAGSDEKCRWLLDDLGFDAAINYKDGDVGISLSEHCKRGIDVYFDNVGGEILDQVLRRINLKARIVLCGLISQYNDPLPVPGPFYFANLLVKRARLEGFIVLDYLDRAAEAISELSKWLAEGRIKYRVELIKGLENATHAVNMLFKGSNRGKLILQVSEEPPKTDKI